MTLYKIRNGYHLRTDRTTTSRVLVHAEEAGGAASKIFQNTTSILSTGDFSGTALWTDGTGAGRGRFSPNAYGATYCNGVESCIYSGDESYVPAAFQLTLDDTELMPNQVDRDFSGASAWVDGNFAGGGGSYDETTDGVLTLAANADNSYCTLPAASAPTTKDVAYRITFDVDSLTDTALYVYAGEAGTDSYLQVASGSSGTFFFDFIAQTSGGIKVLLSTAGGEATLDNFSLKKLQPNDVTEAMNNTLQTTGNYVTWAAASTSSMLLLTGRPLQGIKLYVKTANATTSSLQVRYHTTSGLFTLLSQTAATHSVEGKALAQTGSITFASTDGTAAPFHYNGLYLYAYHLYLTAGSAGVYYITVDAPFQTIKDIWDGVYRVPIGYQFYNATKYEDFTYDVNYESTVATIVGALLDGLVHTTDHIVVVFEEQITGMLVKMLAGYVNTTASVLTVKYWNGSAWTAVSGQADGTSNGGKTHGQSGLIYWLKPTDEVRQNLFNKPGYAYRFEFSATFSGTKGSTAEVVVDTVQGIPAQQDVRPFKFGSEYLGRNMLCGYTAGKEGNRIDYSMPDAPLTFNGDETSRDGSQSIYVSGPDDLEAAITLTNRYGSSIIGVHVVLKRFETHILFGTGPEDFKVYPISYSIGCIAPLSLFTAEVAFGVGAGDESKRNIAGWLSADGPVLFDGTVLIPLSGIRKYFEPEDGDYINLSYVDRSVSYFNAIEKVWNLLIPTGTSTTLNTWLCFDMTRPQKGWFEKVPSEYPQAAFPVIDSSGARHIYGGVDSGYMMQLDYGTSWAGDPIEQVIETGDFGPSGNMFEQTNISEVRAIAKRMSEDQDLTVKHYANTATSATTLGTIGLDTGSARLVRNNINTNKTAWLHRLRFEASTATTDRGVQLIGWGIRWRQTTDDPTT